MTAARIKRLLVIAATIAGTLLIAGCGSGSSDYKVAAIFDNASFLTPGVDVRIAGARVGQVSDLSVTRDHKARVEMTIDRRFAPFHANADCTIQPQSLISERFVNCTPGTPDAAALRAPRGKDPVLGLNGTHSPVDIDQVLNTFQLPVRQRFTLLLDSLGVGLAGRGDDLNAAILRAAPALQATRQTLAILDQDRTQLKQLVTNSDTVLKSLAAGRGRVADFVKQAGVVASTSGDRRRALAASVRDLPNLLTQAKPSLERLGRFAKIATPFTRDLQASAPGLNQLVKQLAPFSRQATPTLVRLGTTARRTTAALPVIAPQLRRIRRFAADAKPASALLSPLLASFRDRGTLEGVQGFLYYATEAVARFDKNSHYLPAYLLPSPCIVYATSPTPGCDAHFAASRAGIQAAARKQDAKKDTKTKAKTTVTPAADAPAAPQPAKPAPSKTPSLPKTVDGLLHALGVGGDPAPSPNAVKGLLGYLLG